MVDDRACIKSYDTRIIIHKINGQNKYRLIEKSPLSLLLSDIKDM